MVGFSVTSEGQGDQWGSMSDLIFLSLADERDRPNFSIDADLDTTIFELAAVWSPGDTRYQGFEAFAGLRYMSGAVFGFGVVVAARGPLLRETSFTVADASASLDPSDYTSHAIGSDSRPDPQSLWGTEAI